MEPSIVKVKEYMLENLAEKISVTRAYVAKVGYIRLKTREDYLNSDNKESFDNFLKELFSKLSKSPYVMDISPRQEELLGKEARDKEFFVTLHLGSSSISLTRPLRMRVVINKRKQEELHRMVFLRESNPEEFSLYFFGSLYAACCPIENVPVRTSIGQISREFLREALAKSEAWELTDGAAPTPIHPEVYILFVKPVEDKDESVMLPALRKIEDDLVIFAPDTMTIDDVMGQFLQDSMFPLNKFYAVQIQYNELDNAVDTLNNLNNELNQLLATYFEKNIVMKFTGNISRHIRKTLSKMHITLRNIAYLEQETTNEKKSAVNYLQKSTFFAQFVDYFSGHMEPSSIIDKNAQLTTMNFTRQAHS